LSVCTLLVQQRKPKLGRTKPLTGPHAARGLDIAGLDVAVIKYVDESGSINITDSVLYL